MAARFKASRTWSRPSPSIVTANIGMGAESTETGVDPARTRYGSTLMAEKQDPTTISFANGSELQVIASPDEIAAAIEKAEGGLLRFLDTNENAVWVNPDHIVHVVSVTPPHVSPA